MQPDRLFQAEQQVHVVNSLAARSLQQVVYHRNDKQLVFIFLEIDQALVRIHHLFQVRVFVCDESERMITLILFVNTFELIQFNLTIQICRSENAS